MNPLAVGYLKHAAEPRPLTRSQQQVALVPMLGPQVRSFGIQLSGRKLQSRWPRSALGLTRACCKGINMRPRALLVAASLVLFLLALISSEAMALDVQQNCESDFKRYCGSYEAYSRVAMHA